MPQKINVAAALIQKYVVGDMVCNFSFMKGYSCRSLIWPLKAKTEIASVRCRRATKVKELKSHTVIPFFVKYIPQDLLSSR